MKEFKMTIDDWSVLMNQQDRIERMLKWLIFDSKLCDEEDWVVRLERSGKYYRIHEQLPDISDILEEK